MLASISNIRPSPDPFGPPSGSKISACFGSVVGSPSAVSTVSLGSASPVLRACKILPLAMALDAMSSRIGPLPLGTAMAMGLVERLAGALPGYGIKVGPRQFRTAAQQ